MTNRITHGKLLHHIDRSTDIFHKNINEGYSPFSVFLTGTIVLYSHFQRLKNLIQILPVYEQYESEEV